MRIRVAGARYAHTHRRPRTVGGARWAVCAGGVRANAGVRVGSSGVRVCCPCAVFLLSGVLYCLDVLLSRCPVVLLCNVPYCPSSACPELVPELVPERVPACPGMSELVPGQWAGVYI